MADSFLNLQLEGDSAARSRLSRFSATARMVTWADKIGPRLAAAVRAEAPVSTGPGGGTLRDSIRYQRSTSLGAVTLKIYTDVPYAKYVVDGTPAHPIDAKVALWLHWVDGGGHDHFAKHVWHPETDPNPFPQKALKKMLPEISASFAEVFEEI